MGAGFAGLQCALRLARRPVDVVLLDRHNYHLFTPLLYQVASSLLNPSEVAVPIRSTLKRAHNVHFRLATVTAVDLAGRIVVTRESGPLPYDVLVLAAGSRTHFFGLDQVAERAYGVKDLPDALALRNHVLESFERAVRESDPAARLHRMTFVVVGGGPTGVEYAGALLELFRLVLVRDFPDLEVERARLVLLEARDRLLPEFPAGLGDYARRRLEAMGVEVRLGAVVEGFGDGAVRLADGDRIDAGTLIWAAGVRPVDLARELGVELGPGGRILVDDRLRVPGRPEVYAIGDLAAATGPAGPLPMMAPPAMQMGRYVADAIRDECRGRTPPPFRYRDKGIMATIGRNAGVAQVGRVQLKGFVGWIAWLLVHLYYLIGFRNRLVVLLEWGWDYFRYDRPIRLITRAGPEPATADPPDGG